MEGKAKTTSVFFAGAALGLALGAAATYKVASQPFQSIVADQFVSGVMTSTHTATRVREGQPSEVTRLVEMNLPNSVRMLHHEYGGHPMTPRALRNIKFYYTKNNIPVPPEIQSILDAVK